MMKVYNLNLPPRNKFILLSIIVRLNHFVQNSSILSVVNFPLKGSSYFGPLIIDIVPLPSIARYQRSAFSQGRKGTAIKGHTRGERRWRDFSRTKFPLGGRKEQEGIKRGREFLQRITIQLRTRTLITTPSISFLWSGSMLTIPSSEFY